MNAAILARARDDFSVTITDASGRTLSGQTIGAFYNCVAHAKPFSVGINCALGGAAMRPYVEELAPSRTATSPAIRTPACRMRLADTMKRPRTWRRCWASSPRTAGSTWSAAAAVRRPRTSPRSPQAVQGQAPRACCRTAARRCASADSKPLTVAVIAESRNSSLEVRHRVSLRIAR